MTIQRSVLLLDDGELGNVKRLLLELGADVLHLKGAEIGRSVEAPRDLLITAGRRTLGDMPKLIVAPDTASPPIWVCIHNQDFLPVRDRFREQGVNYLLQNSLDEQSRRGFLTQLLRIGAEQRRAQRLHLGGAICYRTKSTPLPGKLVDLSTEGSRILTFEEYEPGVPLVTILPSALGGGEELELAGTVLRSTACEMHGAQKRYTTVTRFGVLDDAKRERLGCIIEGKRIGTKITPLAALPKDRGGQEVASLSNTNRRVETRHPYERGAHVIGLEPNEEGPVLGCDLSLTGVRLSGCAGLEVSACVTVALFGSPRDEPTVVGATVLRVNETGEAALVFDELSPSTKQSLEKLLSTQVILDALNQPNSEMGRSVIANVRRSDSV